MKCLMLNADTTPLKVITLQEAFILVYKEKANIITKSDIVWKSINEQFDMPAIVMLKEYKNVPFKKVAKTRNNIFKRDNHTCGYCGSKSDLTLDHIIPKSKGGGDTWENLVTCCRSCNTQKDNLTLEEFELKTGLSLTIKPFKPTMDDFFRSFSKVEHSSWEDYLN